MTKSELLVKLRKEVTAEEYKFIKDAKMPHLSAFNRSLILRMMSEDAVGEESVDDVEVKHLEEITNRYLMQYLAGHPKAWKWICISCVYTAFILKVPMHPQEAVHYVRKAGQGKTEYYCPAKSMQPDTNCSFCVCRHADEAR